MFLFLIPRTTWDTIFSNPEKECAALIFIPRIPSTCRTHPHSWRLTRLPGQPTESSSLRLPMKQKTLLPGSAVDWCGWCLAQKRTTLTATNTTIVRQLSLYEKVRIHRQNGAVSIRLAQIGRTRFANGLARRNRFSDSDMQHKTSITCGLPSSRITDLPTAGDAGTCGGVVSVSTPHQI